MSECGYVFTPNSQRHYNRLQLLIRTSLTRQGELHACDSDTVTLPIFSYPKAWFMSETDGSNVKFPVAGTELEFLNEVLSTVLLQVRLG